MNLNEAAAKVWLYVETQHQRHRLRAVMDACLLCIGSLFGASVVLLQQRKDQGQTGIDYFGAAALID